MEPRAIHLVMGFFAADSDERRIAFLVSKRWNKHVPLASFRIEPQPLSQAFHVMNVIGAGTFSRVRLVRHRDSRFVYAAKSLAKAEQVRLGVCHRVGSEVRCLRSVDHPNIAKFVAAFQDATELHIIQECVYGGELLHIQTTVLAIARRRRSSSFMLRSWHSHSRTCMERTSCSVTSGRKIFAFLRTGT